MDNSQIDRTWAHFNKAEIRVSSKVGFSYRLFELFRDGLFREEQLLPRNPRFYEEQSEASTSRDSVEWFRSFVAQYIPEPGNDQFVGFFCRDFHRKAMCLLFVPEIGTAKDLQHE
ncbi:MAG: hypothetical protein CMO55_16500 [Verrucomicrobiales bacterium]|nr:hypothetical protein [Verrucomicrobiales bacterium]